MIRTSIKYAAIVLASTLPVTGQALGQIAIDQEHVPSNGLGGLEITANQAVAQTFTVGLEGVLARIDITQIRHHNCSSPEGDLELHLRQPVGAGGWNVLLTDSVPPGDVPASPFGVVTFDVEAAGIQVTPGDVLNILLSSPGTAPGGCTYAWNGDLPGTYPGGDASHPPRDMAFRTWVAAATEQTLTAEQDSFLRKGNPDRNEGANPGLRLQASGDNRVVAGFDPAAIDDFGDVTTATLVLTISENANNWGQNDDRTVAAHPLAVDFAEGDGQNAGVPSPQSTRGSGPGVTWNCAEDAEIANQQIDCDPEWDGGNFGAATADPVLHVNGLSGEVSWDVTDDVLAGVSAWLIKKTSERQAGKVSYFSQEGADATGDPDLAPRLILER
jgi:hypothetical protein